MKRNQKQEGSEVKTFTVPFALKESKENISTSIDISKKPSKKQIINQAFKFHSQGNISQAAKYYQDFINQGFTDHRVFSNYGVILKDLGKLEEAELLQRKAIKLNPDFPEAHNNLGDILWDRGNLQEAEISTRKAIELNPDFAKAYSNLGNILKDLGRLKEAEISTRKAIELKPNFAVAHNNLGNILKDLGRLKEAEISTRKAIELKPDLANAYNNLGSILNYLGKFEEVEACYSKALTLSPNSYSVLKNRWQFLFERGEFERALKDSDSCNTKNSRAFALEALYALGRVDEIYKRIEKTSEIDNENIRLAAFASFISAKEHRDTSNNFCRNPISFLYFSNLKSHLKHYDEYIKKIINELAEIKTIWEPSKKATRNGFQTPTHINLFSNSSENISYLKSIILNELDSYYLKFKKESCSYIQKWPSNRNLTAWHVILKKQGYQEAHIHPSGWLSGVIYLKVVPSLGKDEGAIEFSLNGPNYSNINSPNLIHHPEAGDIVLFPSSLHHRTIPFSTDTDRIVMAFDLLPN
ncbi:tetratricopeptide repeat protein [Prochlorococcus marinus]|uniref:tetratricopeptide repeat protein n=1 Tax=Prochlorococcus marinus TaxID=1219 RepID=UPI0022B2C8B4|nr:tetratricopeptide repeat protein [Prochlorococcus marinus]